VDKWWGRGAPSPKASVASHDPPAAARGFKVQHFSSCIAATSTLISAMSQAHKAETAAAAEFIEIDGSKGEGGGQIFRLSIGLSAVTGQPVLNHSVRANRPKPGLALQHLACVRAVQVPPLLYSVVAAHDVSFRCCAKRRYTAQL
jgi:hypothetical protein